eukprot:TRINITY_DN49812_c0_g1_i1.p2 TRINITY_DN49812_c0_g1~~TRINITY_DN49812_c0_g1_i1.p2  ORF type:complete len:211 (+),score=24.38 TRINITY_DN49812_c0_g1_i1:149-781(+)
MSRALSILVIHTSVRGAGSVSRDLTDRLLKRFVSQFPSAKVVEHDLHTLALPAVDGAWAAANFTPEDKRSQEQKDALSRSDKFIAELKTADVVLLGCPVYNFGPPAGLKTWIDLVTRSGHTFTFSDGAPTGLLTKQRFVIAYASSATPVGCPNDHCTPWLRSILGWVGVTADRISIVAAGGTLIDPTAREKAQAQADAFDVKAMLPDSSL